MDETNLNHDMWLSLQGEKGNERMVANFTLSTISLCSV